MTRTGRTKYKATDLAVVEVGGGTIYDLLESEEVAREICKILNDGIGPEWDAVEPELERRLKVIAR